MWFFWPVLWLLFFCSFSRCYTVALYKIQQVAVWFFVLFYGCSFSRCYTVALYKIQQVAVWFFVLFYGCSFSRCYTVALYKITQCTLQYGFLVWVYKGSVWFASIVGPRSVQQFCVAVEICNLIKLECLCIAGSTAYINSIYQTPQVRECCAGMQLCVHFTTRT